MSGVFNYEVFVNLLEESRKPCASCAIWDYTPYKWEMILWTIVDRKLFEYEPDSSKNKRTILDHLIFKKTGAEKIFEKCILPAGSKRTPVIEASGFPRSPRFRSSFTNQHFHYYGHTLYPCGYTDADKDYVNLFFNYLNKGEKKDLTIYETKKCDYDSLAGQWKVMSGNLYNQIISYQDGTILKESEHFAKQGNADLKIIIKKWNEISQEYIAGLTEPKGYCDKAAVLFLQTVAVSVMLTSEEIPEWFSKTQIYLHDYSEMSTRLNNKGGVLSVTDELLERMENRRDRLTEVYKQLIKSLYHWYLFEENEGIDCAEAAMLLEEFRLIYFKLEKNQDFLVFYDKYFRKLFFLTVNNPVIQERVIFRYPTEYKYLFTLYDNWIDFISYRPNSGDTNIAEYNRGIMRKNDLKDKKLIYDHINSGYRPCEFNAVSVGFKEYKLRLRKAKADDFDEIHRLHNPTESWQPKIFFSSDDDGIRYAIEHGQFWVIEDCLTKKLACCTIIVRADHNKDDLERYEGVQLWTQRAKEGERFSEFNSIVVDGDYRGLGFQRLMLSLCYQLAVNDNADFIGSIVSPDNKYSHDNFINMGYEVIENYSFNDYENVTRDIVRIRVKRL